MPFSHKGQTGGGRTLPHCGGILPSAPPAAIPHTIHNPIGAVLPYEPQGLGGETELMLAEEEATRDRRYGLSTIWVNPCQARVCSMEEVVREMTAWVSSWPDWPYTLVQLNEDTYHAPLPKEGNLGILLQGGADMTTCRRISQLEVCLLLVSGLQVTYPVGLIGHKDPIITSLPESLAKLEANLCLLSWVILDTSGHGSGNSTPKRPNPVVILTPPPHKLKDLPRPADTSSQVSAHDDIKLAEASLGEVTTTISPIAVTSRSRSITPPADVGQLQEKTNKSLQELLATKSSIDICRWKAVWELGMELWWNNSETVESIKEAKAIYAHTIWEAKTACSAAVRKAKTQGASQAESLHRKHAEMMKLLEKQVSQEECQSQVDFLSASQATLNTSPVELRGALVASYHILMGQGPTSYPFTLSQGASPLEQLSALAAPSSPMPEWSPRPKKWHSSPVDSMPFGGTTSKATVEGPLVPNGERFHLGTRHSSRAAQKHSAETLA